MAEYADITKTGMAWLPQIPSRWTVRKLKYAFDERSEKGYPDEPLLVSSQNMGVVPKDVYGKRTVEAMKDLDKLKIVKVGDYVVSLRSFQGGIEYAYYQGIISPAYTIIEPHEDFKSDYYKFLFKSVPFIKLLTTCVTGIREGQNIDYKKLKNVQIPVPPRTEQDQIVRFLDWKVSEINKLIGIRRKEIQGLEEMKSLIINTTVTKGITESCTKSSNVPWIGEIPVDWEIIPLKRCLKNITDVDHYMPPSVAHGIPYIMTGDLKEKVSEINFDNCKRISEQDYKALSKKSKAQHGDIVFARYATIGTVSYVDEDRDFIVSYSCVIFKPDSSMIDGRYLFYYLKSRSFSEDVRQYIKINTQGNVGIDSLKRTVLTRPSIDEQHTIVKYLDTKCKKIDELIRLKQSQVQAYQELKSVIISDAVTGKIDVRNITVPEYEHVDDISDDDNEDGEEIETDGEED